MRDLSNGHFSPKERRSSFSSSSTATTTTLPVVHLPKDQTDKPTANSLITTTWLGVSHISDCIVENLLRVSGVLLVFISGEIARSNGCKVRSFPAIYGCLELFGMLPDLSRQFEVIKILPDPSTIVAEAFEPEYDDLDDSYFKEIYKSRVLSQN